MASVLRTTWPLLLGILLLMVGNGMQGTLLGIRGGIEGIPTFQMSIVMSAYFGGFLLGSLIVPNLIQSVGHVRVFAALGSLISAALILYAVAPDWMFWAAMRFVIGFSFCGVYITAESWLNASATNKTRGQALAAYMIVQMVGIILAQFLLNAGDPAGYLLFIIPSVLVSLSFTPILLSAQKAPPFETIQRMSLARLFEASPLGCVGIFLMGGVFSAMFGMSSVWGSAAGLSVQEISIFVAAIYLGGLLFQLPMGWLSDRYDRRVLVLLLAILGTMVIVATVVFKPGILWLTLAGGLVGGVANPIYALLLAYTNDYLDQADMASASAGLLFINGVGSMAGPLITGWLMAMLGPDGFWVYMGVLLAALSLYAGWRMTRRPHVAQEDQGHFAVINPSATVLAVEAALEAAQASDSDAGEGEVGTDVSGGSAQDGAQPTGSAETRPE